jgi:hypothetical protein
MRSRVDRARQIAEYTLRGVAMVALLALLWRSIWPANTTSSDVARGDLRVSLEHWTRTSIAEMHAVLTSAPDPTMREWLRALSRSGGSVRWSSPRAISSAALVAEPAPEPNGATRLRLAAAVGEPISIADAAGLIDTLPRGGATELELATVAGDVRASGATFTAATVARDSVVLRPVLVLGAAGWESKFTTAALEERGWHVASRVRVAPNVEVTQGPLGTIDTSRYSAVIVLDSTVGASAGELARYARSGGGVILAGSAARVGALSSIAPASAGKRIAGVAGGVTSATPRAGLGAFPLTAPKPDVVTLESRGGAIVIGARRIDTGRVMQSGYDETWRWRMAGGDEAAAAHREWWSRLVAAVAYAPIVPRSSVTGDAFDEAPLASLVDALGPPTPFSADLAPHRDTGFLTRLLFALVVVPLLLEWASRRLRGAR